MKGDLTLGGDWRESIAARLMVRVFAFYIIITMAITLIHMAAQFSTTKDEITQSLSIFHNNFKPSLSWSLWTVENKAFEDSMKAIYAVPQVVGAKVIDEEGELVNGIGFITLDGENQFYNADSLLPAASSRSVIGLFSISNDLFHRQNNTDHKVGTLTLYSSNNYVLSQVQNEYLLIILGAIIKTLALWIIVLWQSKPIISQPILNFSKQLHSRNLDNFEDYKLDLKTDGVNELEMLGSAFNHMANNLKLALSRRNQIEKELADRETRLKHALRVSNEGIWDWNIENNDIFYNETFFAMLGYSSDEFELDHRAWIALLHPDDKFKCEESIGYCLSGSKRGFKIEYRLRRKNNNYAWILAKGKVVEHNPEGKPARFVGTHTDISSLKASEENLRKLASFDTLTGLPNRSLFLKLLDEAIAEAKRSHNKHAILYLDLDRFKTINDSLGHTLGDQLLKDVSRRLEPIVRENDTIARLGGDEFTLLLKNISAAHKAAEISNRIIEVLKQPFDLLGHHVVIGPSIGIVLYPDHGQNSEQLLKSADTAMYFSKKKGGGCYHFFSNEMTLDAHTRLETEEAIRAGIRKDEFIVHFQTQIDLETSQINGLESLVRWNKNGQLVTPGNFIPISEETGLIVPMGEIIMRKAFSATRQWVQDGHANIKVSVNISAIQWKQKDILERIELLLNETGLSPEYIELELTEAVVMENIDTALNKMKKIKDRGISLALDDFGTGYSSLSYLKKFPIDTLKIDRSFIIDMETSKENENIVKTIIELAHHLSLKVVAEGVEQESQLALLHAMQCDTIQGYLFSRPIDQSTATELLYNAQNPANDNVRNCIRKLNVG